MLSHEGNEYNSKRQASENKSREIGESERNKSLCAENLHLFLMLVLPTKLVSKRLAEALH